MTPFPHIDVDALVVGAGPAGSAVAARLAAGGLDVLLVDRATFPRTKPCAEYLSPATVDLVTEIAGEEVLAEGNAVPLSGTTVVAGGASLTGLFAEAPQGTGGRTGMALPRSTLDASLLHAARTAGAGVRQGTTLLEVFRNGEAVTGARCRDERGEFTVGARITIGADGLQSRVAAAFGGRRHGVLRRWAFVTHMRGVEGLVDKAELHLTPGGYVGLNPLPGGLANVALVLSGAAFENLRGDREAFLLRTVRRRFPGLWPRLERAAPVTPVQAVGPFDVRARRPAVPGGLLVGDAADFFDPFTGEGIHAALTGARLAAETILPLARNGGSGPLPIPLAYLSARRRTFLGKWAVERLIGYGMLAPRMFERAVARIGRRPPMAHTMIGVTGHLVSPGRVLNPWYLARMLV